MTLPTPEIPTQPTPAAEINQTKPAVEINQTKPAPETPPTETVTVAQASAPAIPEQPTSPTSEDFPSITPPAYSINRPDFRGASDRTEYVSAPGSSEQPKQTMGFDSLIHERKGPGRDINSLKQPTTSIRTRLEDDNAIISSAYRDYMTQLKALLEDPEALQQKIDKFINEYKPQNLIDLNVDINTIGQYWNQALAQPTPTFKERFIKKFVDVTAKLFGGAKPGETPPANPLQTGGVAERASVVNPPTTPETPSVPVAPPPPKSPIA